MNASYRALPKSQSQIVCSGRTALCNELLNDTWVSFPAWSEDSSFGASLKTKYEETMYRIEDERFELDMAIQTNSYVIDVLSNIQKRIQKMTDEEKSAFSLDDNLGGTSSALNFRFLHRIYGDRTKELMEGLKRNPIVAVPIVLNRLRMREKEWKEVQQKYNAVWSDQINRIYLKSLDHQGINFKQNDGRNLRPKTLLNEIETLYQERKQKIIEGSAGSCKGPHIKIELSHLYVFKDAVNLILQDVKKQSGAYKVDRKYIADLLNCFIASFFFMQGEIEITECAKQSEQNGTPEDTEKSPEHSSAGSGDSESEDDDSILLVKTTLLENISARMYQKLGISTDKYDFMRNIKNDLDYSLFYLNNSWYIFFRLFSVLIQRLSKLYVQSLNMETKQKSGPGASKETSGPYAILLSKTSTLLSGKIDSSKFEDEMRELFTIHAYVSYTFDKVIHAIVKQMHMLCSDDISRQCLTLYAAHVINMQHVTSPSLINEAEIAYKKKVVEILGEDNCYKVIWAKNTHILAIELLETTEHFPENYVNSDLSDYLDLYLVDDALEREMPMPEDKLPVILPRTLRKQRKFWEKIMKESDQLLSEKPFNCMVSSTSSHKQGVKRKRKSKNYRSVKPRQISQPPSQRHNSATNKSARSECSKEEQKIYVKEEVESDEVNSVERDYASPLGQDENFTMDIEEQNHGQNQKNFILNQDNGNIGYNSNGEKETEDAESGEGNMAGEEDEDSINVSAEDLLYHLSQTGMAIFDHLPGSFVAATSELAQKSHHPDYLDTRKSSSNLKSSATASQVQKRKEDNIGPKDLSQSKPETSSSESNKKSDMIESKVQGKTTQNVKKRQEEMPPGVFVPAEPWMLDNKPKVESSSESHEQKPVLSPKQNISSVSENKYDLKQATIEIKVEAESSAAEDNDALLRDIPSTSTDHRSVATGESQEAGTLSNTRNAPDMESVQADGSLDELSRDSDACDSDNQENTLQKCFEFAIQNLIKHDRMACAFDPRTSKIMFGHKSEALIYRVGSLAKAKKSHRKFSISASEKLSIWHRSWLETNVTTNMMKSCNDWLMRCELGKYRVDCITINAKTKPPYNPYSKYVIRSCKRHLRK